MSEIIKKGFKILKKEGINGIKKRLNKPKLDVVKNYGFITNMEEIAFEELDYKAHKYDEKKILNWIVPEIGIGSGGHINIFRFVSYLEINGFHSRIYTYRGKEFHDNESLEMFLRTYFPILDERVEAFYDVNQIEYAHAIVATSWDTAYFVRRYHNTISKFYFVQDFEPYFYPIGSEYNMAEATYGFGFRGITAGDWLKEKLSQEYRMQTSSFGFSYDKDLYVPQKKKDSLPRVFFYARPVTPRRDFELGLLALDLLKKKISNLEIIFAGWKIDQYEIPFEYCDMGILALNQLSEIYGQCDMCLIMSNTNLSLLPLEVMASNSVVVSSEGKNNEWLVTDENAIIVSYDPIEIANKMYEYLTHLERLNKIRQRGLEFAQSTSWNKEGEKVKKALLEGIKEDEEKKCADFRR